MYPHLIRALIRGNRSLPFKASFVDGPDQSWLAPESLVDRVDRYARLVCDGADRDRVAGIGEVMLGGVQHRLLRAASLRLAQWGIVTTWALDVQH